MKKKRYEFAVKKSISMKVSVSLPDDEYASARRRQVKWRFPKFSHYIQALVRADLASKQRPPNCVDYPRDDDEVTAIIADDAASEAAQSVVKALPLVPAQKQTRRVDAPSRGRPVQAGAAHKSKGGQRAVPKQGTG